MIEDTYTEDLAEEMRQRLTLADPAVAGVYVHSTRSPDVKRIR